MTREKLLAVEDNIADLIIRYAQNIQTSSAEDVKALATIVEAFARMNGMKESLPHFVGAVEFDDSEADSHTTIGKDCAIRTGSIEIPRTICSSCGAENLITDNFCQTCGKKLRDVCDCWVWKRSYNCGQDKCLGRKLRVKEDFYEKK